MDFFSNVSKTIGRSIGPVTKTFIGVLPIFIGANFLGVCIFWRSERFGSYSDGMFTLFAAMNGDNLANVYNDLANYWFIWANLFLYTYIFFSIAVILNIFTIIIEEAYITAKYTKKMLEGNDKEEIPWNPKLDYHEEKVMGREKRPPIPDSESHLELIKLVKNDLKGAEEEIKENDTDSSKSASSSKSMSANLESSERSEWQGEDFRESLQKAYNEVIESIDKLKAQWDLSLT